MSTELTVYSLLFVDGYIKFFLYITVFFLFCFLGAKKMFLYDTRTHFSLKVNED